MDRFPLESTADLAANHALYMALHVWGDDITSSVAVNESENCDRACETLHPVPGFDFMGCNQCFDEALAEIAKERAEELSAARSGETQGKAA